MMQFSEWLNFRESTFDYYEEKRVSGEGIKALQAALRDMASRGAPNEYNDYGFNKQDWNTYEDLLSSGHMDSSSVPVRIVRRMLDVLSHYQNTQYTNYREISKKVMEDIGMSSSENVVIFDKSPMQYGKIKITIPHGLDRGSLIRINKILDGILESEGAERSRDNYGNFVFPRYKKFSKDKLSPHTYWIHPSVLEPIVSLLKQKGLSVEFESGKSDIGSMTSSMTQQQPQNQQEDVIVLGQERTSYGNKVVVKFNYEKSKGIYQRLKGSGLTPKGISYDFDRKVFLVNIDDSSLLSRLISFLKDEGLDSSPLEKFMPSGAVNVDSEEEPVDDSNNSSKENIIRFADAPENSIKIKTDVRGLSQERKNFVRESIQYTFPDYYYDMKNHHYVVSGNFKQYSLFGILLKKFGYPVENLRKIIRAKIDSGRLSVTDWEGKYDKDKGFQDSIDKKIPESMVDLYDEQKFGVAFLYGRDHAILGDETGFGKSIQLITAAALRMQSNRKPTLIITLKATQKQFAEEIIRVMGENEKNQISLDPMTPKKWTVIRYSDFSGGKQARNDKVKQYVDSLRRAGFGIAILDELHKVKHSRSQRSENIASVVDTIPTRWGASATVSSNKPMDVKNQLLMMGHHLGKVKDAKFKKDFAGMVAGGYRGSLKKSDNEEDEIKAAERLNKWLNLSGVYVRREKGDIREMPELSVDSTDTQIDRGRFDAMYSAKVQTYKDPTLPVSQLIAARETIAQIKTTETSKKVIDIVAAGEGKPPAASKVVVFTNFIEAGRHLVNKISEGLKNINPSYGVITYLSDTTKKEREQVKSKFTNDPNLKVLVMSMKMGGTGIDFPNAAQHMVINDFDWTPESAEQSEGRIYRINTDHPVKIQYIVGQGLDSELFKKVQKKREIAAIIQKYRREYHDSEDAAGALKKIVDAQKEIRKIDDDMAKIVAANLPGAEEAMKESFSGYLERLKEISEMLFYAE